MNRHMGTSTALSVLTVVFFAVVLYRPDPIPGQPPPSPTPTQSPPAPVPEPEPAPAPTDPSLTKAAPPPTPGVPLVEPPTAKPAVAVEEVRKAPSAVVRSRPEPPRTIAVPIAATAHTAPPVSKKAAMRSRPASSEGLSRVQTASQRKKAVPVPSQPRGAFTEVFEGESMADVAVRVYGNPDATKSLWLANRDIVKAQDEILRGGTFLRTP